MPNYEEQMRRQMEEAAKQQGQSEESIDAAFAVDEIKPRYKGPAMKPRSGVGPGSMKSRVAANTKNLRTKGSVRRRK